MNEPLEQVEAQPTGADDAQPEAVTADLTADVSTDAPADAEPAADPTPDPLEALLSDESLRSRLFEHPSVTEKFKERENAGANRERERLKREAGKEEPVRQFTTRLAQRWDEMTPEERARDAGFTFSNAAAHVAYELTRQWPDVLKQDDIEIPSEVRDKAVRILEDGVDYGDGTRGPNHDGYLRTLIVGAGQAIAAKQISAMTVKDVPEGTILHRDIAAEVNKRVAAELKAKQAEAATVAAKANGAMPTAPAATTAAEVPYHLLSTAERNALSQEERDRRIAADYAGARN